MKVALYTRVSTDEQTIQTQERELLAYCEFKGWEPVVFRDEGVSGSKTSRPQFDKMMAAVRAGEFGGVMCWRFDRMSRSLRHLLSILEELDESGIAFISVREQIDTSTPAGRLMFAMVGAFAQFERDVISQRTSATMQRLKAEGKRVSRERGFDWGQVSELRDRGLSAKDAAAELGISESHCRRIYRQLKEAA